MVTGLRHKLHLLNDSIITTAPPVKEVVTATNKGDAMTDTSPLELSAFNNALEMCKYCTGTLPSSMVMIIDHVHQTSPLVDYASYAKAISTFGTATAIDIIICDMIYYARDMSRDLLIKTPAKTFLYDFEKWWSSNHVL
jgi:hypothetical protein